MYRCSNPGGRQNPTDKTAHWSAKRCALQTATVWFPVKGVWQWIWAERKFKNKMEREFQPNQSICSFSMQVVNSEIFLQVCFKAETEFIPYLAGAPGWDLRAARHIKSGSVATGQQPEFLLEKKMEMPCEQAEIFQFCCQHTSSWYKSNCIVPHRSPKKMLPIFVHRKQKNVAAIGEDRGRSFQFRVSLWCQKSGTKSRDVTYRRIHKL